MFPAPAIAPWIRGFPEGNVSIDPRPLFGFHQFGLFQCSLGRIGCGLGGSGRRLIGPYQESYLKGRDENEHGGEYGQSQRIVGNFLISGVADRITYWRMLFGALLIGILLIAGSCIFDWMMGWK